MNALELLVPLLVLLHVNLTVVTILAGSVIWLEALDGFLYLHLAYMRLLRRTSSLKQG
jgi:hypothetical protein